MAAKRRPAKAGMIKIPRSGLRLTGQWKAESMQRLGAALPDSGLRLNDDQDVGRLRE